MTTAPAWDANLYDEKHSFVWKKAADLLELLAPQAGERILDVGCGTGHLTAQIASAGAEVVGIDSSEEMIREARGRYAHLRFEVGDAREIRLPETFDAVFSNATLHWIREPERVIASIHRVLKPGGRFIAEFGGKGNVQKLMNAFFRAFAALGMPHGSEMNLWYYPSVAEYAGLLEAQGFEVDFAALFPRPTVLEDAERGLEAWIRMFGRQSFLARVPEEQRDLWIREVERQCRGELFRNGSWELDYRRLRVRARLPKHVGSAPL
jgi:trans-aconitate methyltransferase